MRLAQLVFVVVAALAAIVVAGEDSSAASAHRDPLRAMLELHEGRSFKVYKCTAGARTIGVGHNLDAWATPAQIRRFERSGATNEEIEQLLTRDIARVRGELNRHFGEERWFQRLSPVRRLVLEDMCFNLGIGRLKEFKRMFRALQREDFSAAASEMLDSQWAKQVGQRSRRLAEMMRSGRMSDDFESTTS